MIANNITGVRYTRTPFVTHRLTHPEPRVRLAGSIYIKREVNTGTPGVLRVHREVTQAYARIQ